MGESLQCVALVILVSEATASNKHLTCLQFTTIMQRIMLIYLLRAVLFASGLRTRLVTFLCTVYETGFRLAHAQPRALFHPTCGSSILCDAGWRSTTTFTAHKCVVFYKSLMASRMFLPLETQ